MCPSSEGRQGPLLTPLARQAANLMSFDRVVATGQVVATDSAHPGVTSKAAATGRTTGETGGRASAGAPPTDLKELPAPEEFAELRERYERNLSPPAGVPTG